MEPVERVASRFQQLVESQRVDNEREAPPRRMSKDEIEWELQRRINAEYERLDTANPDALVCPHCAGIGYVTLAIPYNHPVLHPWIGKAFPCPCKEQDRNRRRMAKLEKSYSLPADHLAYTLAVWNAMDMDLLAGKDLALRLVNEFADQGLILTKSGKSKPWLVFSGDPGKGKTSLACALSMTLIEDGNDVQWTDFNELVEDVQSTYDKKDKLGPSRATVIGQAQGAKVLCLDDMGDIKRISQISDDRRDIAYSVIRPRAIHRMQTIITTNLSKEQFKFQFGERIASRVFHLSAWIEVKGAYLREK